MTVILFQEREKERAENEDADDDDDDEDEEDQTEDDDEEVEEEDNEKGYSLRRNRAEPSRYGTLAKQPRVTVVKRNRPAVALFSRSGQSCSICSLHTAEKLDGVFLWKFFKFQD